MVKRTLSLVSTSTKSLLIWLLVLILPPKSVRQSLTSHSSPRVVILEGLAKGMIPTFSVKRPGPTGVEMRFKPFSSKKMMLSGVTRYNWPSVENKGSWLAA